MIMSAREPGLTEREAYSAMLLFIEAYWQRGERKSGDIAILLGSAAMSADAQPQDLALWQDWLEAVAQARHRVSEG